MDLLPHGGANIKQTRAFNSKLVIHLGIVFLPLNGVNNNAQFLNAIV